MIWVTQPPTVPSHMPAPDKRKALTPDAIDAWNAGVVTSLGLAGDTPMVMVLDFHQVCLSVRVFALHLSVTVRPSYPGV